MNRAALPGLLVVLGFGSFILLALVLLFLAGDGLPLERLAGRQVRAILTFTLTQSLLSTGLSIAGALPLAVLLHRHRAFVGRDTLVRLLALPLALPPLVAVLGILEIWGRSGVVSAGLQSLGFDVRLDVFGLQGVLLAHVFFNLPLAARLMLAHLERQPATTFRLADQLGLVGWARFTRVEWPLLRPSLGGVAGLIMMLCIGSFTIVLTLGGGPRAATFEVAIYQALRFDFAPSLAALYTLIQLVLAGTLLFLLSVVGGAPQDRAGALPEEAGFTRPVPVWGVGLLILTTLFLLAPLAALVAGGLVAEWGRLIQNPRLWSAAMTSGVIAACAGLVAVATAYALLVARSRGFGANGIAKHLFEAGYGAVGSAVLAVPPIVLGAGWFLALRGVPAQTLLAGGLVMLVNALMALPVVVRGMAPAFAASERRYGALSSSLGLTGWRRFVRVDLPVLARPFAVALAFALVLSVGDLGAAAIFGAYDLVTLPVLILNLMGSYRTGDAAGVAFLLGVFVFALIAMAERSHKVLG
ncbi:MAG: thiamine/thiamine pyrophosphate ABC transporter permease ThiP [Cohaesibacteraceae bacterium]